MSSSPDIQSRKAPAQDDEDDLLSELEAVMDAKLAAQHAGARNSASPSRAHGKMGSARSSGQSNTHGHAGKTKTTASGAEITGAPQHKSVSSIAPREGASAAADGKMGGRRSQSIGEEKGKAKMKAEETAVRVNDAQLARLATGVAVDVTAEPAEVSFRTYLQCCVMVWRFTRANFFFSQQL